MAKQSKNNKQVTFENQVNYTWWRNKLIDFYMALFKWNNLPFEKEDYKQIEDYLNGLFITSPAVGFTYLDSGVPVIGKATACEGYNWFGGASGYNLDNHVTSIFRNKNKIAIGFNSPTKQPLCYLFDHYAKILSDIDGTEDVNLKGQNTPMIISAPHGQELTLSNAVEQITGHKPVVFGRDTLVNGNQKFLEYCEPSKYLCDKLELYRGDVMNRFFGEFGVSSHTAEKRAQLISAEIDANKESISVYRNIYLNARERFCESINDLFGLNVSVEFNIERVEQTKIAFEHAKEGYTTFDEALDKEMSVYE